MCSREKTTALRLRVHGLLTSNAYQRAKSCVETLHRYLPERFPAPEMHGMLDVDWNEYLIAQRRELGGPWWNLQRPVAVFFNDKFIGSDQELYDLLPTYCVFYLPPEQEPRRVAQTSYCYMDITVENQLVGSFTFELFTDVAPKTCENFRRLCVESPGYKDTVIHRIAVPSWIQGGIMQSGHVDTFPDESYAISHDKRGILSMANDGRHTNGSQFLITLGPAIWMDRKYVAFGRLVEGAQTLALIEQVPTYYEMPTRRIQVVNCGVSGLAPCESENIVSETSEEITSELLVKSILDSILQIMVAGEPEQADERDVESQLALDKFEKGEYSAGITEDMLSDYEMDEDLPEAVRIVWVVLRELLGNATLVQSFAKKLVDRLVEAALKDIIVKEFMAAFKEWPTLIETLMALIRKVLKDTKRLLDIMDCGPNLVLVRELLDEVLDCAIAQIESQEEQEAMRELENRDIIKRSSVIISIGELITEMVNQVLVRSSLRDEMGELNESEIEMSLQAKDIAGEQKASTVEDMTRTEESKPAEYLSELAGKENISKVEDLETNKEPSKPAEDIAEFSGNERPSAFKDVGTDREVSKPVEGVPEISGEQWSSTVKDVRTDREVSKPVEGTPEISGEQRSGTVEDVETDREVSTPEISGDQRSGTVEDVETDREVSKPVEGIKEFSGEQKSNIETVQEVSKPAEDISEISGEQKYSTIEDMEPNREVSKTAEDVNILSGSNKIGEAEDTETNREVLKPDEDLHDLSEKSDV